jgi:lipoprotein-anchoring transpeptidase ErfK/SrfK
MEALRRARAESNADAALGVSVYPEERAAEMAMITPRGEFRVIRKSYTAYMIGGSGASYYNLPGVAFPTYFTASGIAIHGTYWHHDYGRPKSHGCVNVPNDAAQWVFRWSEPQVPYTDHMRRVKKDEGTLIRVI